MIKVGRKFYLALSLSALSVILAAYWGCGDVRLAKLPPPVESTSVKPNISVCSFAETKDLTDKLKIAFVLDMSGSNIVPTVPPGSSKSSVLPATDKAGARFDALQDFIDQHPDFGYKIIGFSNTTLGNVNCGSGFDNSGVALAQLDALRGIQAGDIATLPNRINMKETMYNQALECAQSVIAQESATEPEFAQTHYKIFFVTDGEATDKALAIDMVGKIVDMGIVATEAGSFQLIPVYYGSPSIPSGAMDILGQMGKAGHWRNPATPTKPETPLLAAKVSQLNFDKLLSYTLTQQYRILEFNLVNLNSRAEGGFLLSDSDSDGIPDARDVGLTSPVSRRSNSQGILDGICERMGGPSLCKAPSVCDISKTNNFKMNSCDVGALGLTNILDEDKDRIPDFMEFLFGTNPSVNDALGDMDNDGLTNITEIHQGTRPDDPKAFPAGYKTLWHRVLYSSDTPDCPANQELWQIQVDQVPTVPTLAFSDPSDAAWVGSDVFSLSHAADENVLFAYYIQQAVNGDEPKAVLYGKIIKVKYGAFQSITISPLDFERLGEIGSVGEYK